MVARYRPLACHDIQDTGRGISNISYNHLDRPGSIDFGDGSSVTYTYSATGQKLSSTYSRNLPTGERSETRYYCGGAEFVKNGTAAPTFSRCNTAWGYIDSKNTINLYVRDYQGNIRGVMSSTGAVLQTTDYYPYGVPMQSSTGAEVNRYKYGGKEFETERGLNHYDFEARTLIPQICLFSTPDPKAGDYPGLNPYLYCAANPLKYIDPTGKDIWKINENGEIEETEVNKEKDAFIFINSEGNTKVDSDGNQQILEFEYGTVIRTSKRHYAPFQRKNGEKILDGKADIIEIRGDENATKLFEAFAQNVTAITGDEISLIKAGIEGDEGHDFISSGHVRGSEPGMSHLYNTQLKYLYNIREMIHSHPQSNRASGDDVDVKNDITDLHLKVKTIIPQFKIYHVPTKKYVDY